MKPFEALNPYATAIYFLAVTSLSLFCQNPILVLLSLFGSILFFLLHSKQFHIRFHLEYLAFFCMMALLNPLVSHNGSTILFVVNDTPFTLESLLYGITASGMMLGALYWFRSFAQIMTADKLLYLFGKLSPKLSLTLSMGLRYLPLLTRQAKKINETQTALGLYREDNLIDRTKGKLRVTSALLGWGLENGIITADSMTARGYGIAKRNHFSVFRFQAADLLCLIWTLTATVLTSIALLTGALQFRFYPTCQAPEATPLAWMGYLSYGFLVLLPSIFEIKEDLKWKYLQSRI